MVVNLVQDLVIVWLSLVLFILSMSVCYGFIILTFWIYFTTDWVNLFVCQMFKLDTTLQTRSTTPKSWRWGSVFWWAGWMVMLAFLDSMYNNTSLTKLGSIILTVDNARTRVPESDVIKLQVFSQFMQLCILWTGVLIIFYPQPLLRLKWPSNGRLKATLECQFLLLVLV